MYGGRILAGRLWHGLSQPVISRRQSAGCPRREAATLGSNTKRDCGALPHGQRAQHSAKWLTTRSATAPACQATLTLRYSETARLYTSSIASVLILCSFSAVQNSRGRCNRLLRPVGAGFTAETCRMSSFGSCERRARHARR